MNTNTEIAALLDRLTRLHAADRRSGNLNDAQLAALDYLGRANRFSRAPSTVADYLAATRGTVSQTLKALSRKRLVTETGSQTDQRVRRYDLTAAGAAAVQAMSGPDLPEAEARVAARALRTLVAKMIAARDGRSFGLCRTCRYHQERPEGRHCALLQLALRPEEADQICREHRVAA